MDSSDTSPRVGSPQLTKVESRCTHTWRQGGQGCVRSLLHLVIIIHHAGPRGQPSLHSRHSCRRPRGPCRQCSRCCAQGSRSCSASAPVAAGAAVCCMLHSTALAPRRGLHGPSCVCCDRLSTAAVATASSTGGGPRNSLSVPRTDVAAGSTCMHRHVRVAAPAACPSSPGA
jgi:hypothetical protein